MKATKSVKQVQKAETEVVFVKMEPTKKNVAMVIYKIKELVQL
jgi:hypothetical protein